MTILRLRAEIADERGRLGDIATTIAACRGNIRGLDVHFLDGSRVADEFVIEFEEENSGTGLATALRRAGGVNVEVEELDEHAVVDPVTRAIHLCGGLLNAGTSRWALETCVAQLVRAQSACVVDKPPTPEETPTVRRLAGGWLLVVPVAIDSERRWLVVERTSPAFSSSEVARVGALVRLAGAAAVSARELAESARDRLGPPGPVRRRPATFFRSRPAAYASTS